MSGSAAPVRVHLPPLLAPVTGGARMLEAEGATIRAVLDDLAARHPALALHLFDEGGAVRRNIICIYKDAVVRAGEIGDQPVAPGEEIVLSNALAGG